MLYSSIFLMLSLIILGWLCIQLKHQRDNIHREFEDLYRDRNAMIKIIESKDSDEDKIKNLLWYIRNIPF